VLDAVFVPAVRRPLRWSTVGLGALAVTFAVLISVLRYGINAVDTIWAEDGAVFLTDAANLSFADTVLTPYAGYRHVLPRLAAGFVLLFPVAWLAMAVSVTAAAVNAGLGLVVYHASGALRTPILRAAVAAVAVVVPRRWHRGAQLAGQPAVGRRLRAVLDRALGAGPARWVGGGADHDHPGGLLERPRVRLRPACARPAGRPA
jgi:hypothetical protein